MRASTISAIIAVVLLSLLLTTFIGAQDTTDFISSQDQQEEESTTSEISTTALPSEYTVYVDGAAVELPRRSRTPPLYQYMEIPDTQFQWTSNFEPIQDDQSIKVKWYLVQLTSLQWLTTEETSSSVWNHNVLVGIPYGTPIISSKAMLYITACSKTAPITNSCYNKEAALMGQVAAHSGLPVVILFNIPNQSTSFPADAAATDLTEDHLVAYTWKQAMLTPSRPDWNIYFPMSKAALRTMDAIEAWSQQMVTNGVLERPINKWFPMGASKRGAATWLLLTYLGAKQPNRIFGAAPVVYDALDFRQTIFEGMPTKLGAFTHAFLPYKPIMDLLLDATTSRHLIKHIDPIEPWYLRGTNRVKKYVIAAAQDEFFLLGNDRYWFDSIENKYRLTVPEANHGFDQGAETLLLGLANFARGQAIGARFPKVSSDVNHRTQTVIQCSDEKPTRAVYYRGEAVQTTPQRIDYRLLRGKTSATCEVGQDMGPVCAVRTMFDAETLPVSRNRRFGHGLNNDNDDASSTFIGRALELFQNRHKKWCATYTEENVPGDTYVTGWITFSWDKLGTNGVAHMYNTPAMVLPDSFAFPSCLTDPEDCPVDVWV